MKLMAAWRQRGAEQASCGRTRREVETGECCAGPWLPPQACAPGVARKKLCYGIFCSSPYGKPAARWGRSFLPLAAPTAPTKPCTGCLWRAAKGLAPRRANPGLFRRPPAQCRSCRTQAPWPTSSPRAPPSRSWTRWPGCTGCPGADGGRNRNRWVVEGGGGWERASGLW